MVSNKSGGYCYGAIFEVILDTDECKFERSANGDYLRKTSNDGEKTSQEIYKYDCSRTCIKGHAGEKFIRKYGGKWLPLKKGRIGKAVMYEHVDNRDMLTGCCMTVTTKESNRILETYYKKVE